MAIRGLEVVLACTKITGVWYKFEVFGAVDRNDGTFGSCEPSPSETSSVCRLGISRDVSGSTGAGSATVRFGAVMLDIKFSLDNKSVLEKLEFREFL